MRSKRLQDNQRKYTEQRQKALEARNKRLASLNQQQQRAGQAFLGKAAAAIQQAGQIDQALKGLEEKESQMLGRLHETLAKERAHTQTLLDVKTSPAPHRELRFDNYFYSYINDPTGTLGTPNLSPFNTARTETHRHQSPRPAPEKKEEPVPVPVPVQAPFQRRPSDPRRAQIVAENMRVEPGVRVMTSEELGAEKADDGEYPAESDIVQQIVRSLPFQVRGAAPSEEDEVSLSQVFRYDHDRNPWEAGLAEARDQVYALLKRKPVTSEQGQGSDIVTRKELEASLTAVFKGKVI